MATVSFIPNDPMASGGPPMQQVTTLKQPSGSARFDVRPSAAPGQYPSQTPEFDYWQVQQALIKGLRSWRNLTGQYPQAWYGNQAQLPVLTDAGDDLNAFYDRQSLQFFHHTFDGRTVHSGESVDVVVHEEGHALLDMIRPDFFDVPFLEVGALHESFGDCNALLTALNDASIRNAVLAASPDLSGAQFVEALAEELGDAIRREYGPASVEDGALRNALNTFSWVDPTTLPPNAPASSLAGEVHSFSRVFTGAFYDSLRNMFMEEKTRNGASLGRTARTLGKLLITGLRAVSAAPRTFEGVGRRMVETDAALNKGANAAAIRAAFATHGLPLPAPAVDVAVPLRSRTRGGSARQLRDELGVAGNATLRMTPVESDVHGDIAHVTAFRSIELTEGELTGVRLMVPAVATVRTRGGSVTGVIGDIKPVDLEAEREGRAFASVLLANGDIRPTATTGPGTGRRTRGGGQRTVHISAAPRPSYAPFPPTHEIRVVAGQPTLARVGFSA